MYAKIEKKSENKNLNNKGILPVKKLRGMVEKCVVLPNEFSTYLYRAWFFH